MIKTEKDIKNKGLRELILTGSTKNLPTEHLSKLKNILFIMTETTTLDDFRARPGSRLHQLKGDFKNFWSITVTGNYRIIFLFQNGYFSEIDYIDYH